MGRSGLMRVHNAGGLAGSLLGGLLLLAFLMGLSSCVPLSRLTAAADSLRTTKATILDLRIYGMGDPASPPILRIADKNRPASGLGNDALTLAFEMRSDAPPNLVLQLVHCDRNWVPTENIFVQDPIRLQSTEFFVERAPIGVRYYDYMANISFPQPGSRLQLEHAGNYRALILDYYDRKTVLAETRFFVVQGKADVDVTVFSDFYTSAQTEELQHGLKVQVEAQPDLDMFGSQINQIALYQKGAWYSPMLASPENDRNDRLPGTAWVQWFPSFSGKSIAVFSNLPAGNEHRLLDLTDLIYYPSTGGTLSTPLSDLPRNGFTQFDNNGVTPDRYVPLSDADYVDFEFRLDLKGFDVKEDIFVVGTFNNWLPTLDWKMHYDTASRFFVARGPIRRAFHEYEYISGHWDADAMALRDGDGALLEGNLTAASIPYYAFVYYRDIASGGYDRIIGVGVDISGNRN